MLVKPMTSAQANVEKSATAEDGVARKAQYILGGLFMFWKILDFFREISTCKMCIHDIYSKKIVSQCLKIP